MSTNTLIGLLLAACLAMSFLMSGMEAGVFALSRLRIRRQMRAGLRSAKVLHEYLDNPENFLWTILVGNTVANYFIVAWLVVKLHGLLVGRHLWFLVAFSAAVFLFYAFFDLLPKMLFRSFPNRLCLVLARPFRLVHFLLRPLVALVEWASARLLRWRGGQTFKGRLFGNREELRQVMQESGQAFSSEERAMINRVLDLQSQTVRQAMVPLALTATASTEMTVNGALQLCRDRRLTRLPVWDNRARPPRVVGLISVNSLLYQPELNVTKSLAEFVKPALYLDESMRLEVALRRMQRGGQRLAIVVGADQRVSGILSFQDVLRVIFGEVSL
jgi:putative hemolysin